MSLPYQFWPWAGAVVGLFFIFALGAIVGSFVNVLVYRLPQGMNVVHPPSRCPACATKLTWRENVPILGWMFLRGRCRFCRSPISPEYPLVEFLVALLFALPFSIWFMQPSIWEALGMSSRSLAAISPDWTQAGLLLTWPMLLIIYTLVASLVAITLIDARTFMIPLALPWVAGVVALGVHPLHAIWIHFAQGDLPRTDFAWTIPLPPDWRWTGAALGAGAGVVISGGLLALRILPRSFADYEAWEESVRADTPTLAEPDSATPPQAQPLGPALLRTLLFTGPAIALMLLGAAFGARMNAQLEAMAFGGVIGLAIGALLRRLGPDDRVEAAAEPHFTDYPHARREMGREILFLLAPAALAIAGFALGGLAGAEDLNAPPLVLRVLGGTLLGLVVGGGLVWIFRIAGTLALGKEAMGLGDVHLMAAVGAALGWVDSVLAFFLAPFFGILWAMASVLRSSVFQRQGSALPYGPHLAAAAVVVLYGKPLFERILSLLAHQPINLP